MNENIFKELSEKWQRILLDELCEKESDDYDDCLATLLSIKSAVWDSLRLKGYEDKEITQGFFLEEKTLSFVLPFLKNNELVMLHYDTDTSDPNRWYMKNIRISSPKTAEEDIDFIRKEWEKYPEYTEANTLFYLPKNINYLEDYVNLNTKPKNKK